MGIPVLGGSVLESVREVAGSIPPPPPWGALLLEVAGSIPPSPFVSRLCSWRSQVRFLLPSVFEGSVLEVAGSIPPPLLLA